MKPQLLGLSNLLSLGLVLVEQFIFHPIIGF
jgi:hypothetical protein